MTTLVVVMVLSGVGPWTPLDVGSPGFAYPEFAPNRTIAAATATSGMTLVVWADRRRGLLDLFASRVSAAGVVLDVTGIPLVEQPTPFDQAVEGPAIATDGSSWLVAWRRGTAIEFLRFDQTGAVSAVTTASVIGLGDPAVRYDQGSYLLAWPREIAPQLLVLSTLRVSPGGSIGAATTIGPLSDTLVTSLVFARQPSTGLLGLAYAGTPPTGGRRSMRWTSGGDSGVSLAGGAPMGPDCASVSAGETASSTTFLCFDSTTFPSRVSGVQWFVDGGASSFTVSAVSQRTTPAAGALGGSSIIAWGNLASTISLGREPSFPQPFATVPSNMNQVTFAQGPTTRLFQEGLGVRFVELPNVSAATWVSTATNSQTNPLGTFADGRFLVAWEDGRAVPSTVHWTRIAEDGAIETPAGLELTSGTGGLRTLSLGSVSASGPASAAVIYNDLTGRALCGRIGPGFARDAGAVAAPTGQRAAFNQAGLGLLLRGFTDVTARLIGPDCEVRSADLLLADAGFFANVAWDGTSFLTAWESGGVVRARSVAVDGGLGPVFDVGFTNTQARVQLSGAPGEVLALWHADNSIRMARVSADAGLLVPGGVPLPTNSPVSFEPRAVFTGTNWLVVWMDSYSGRVDVTVRRVTSAGVPLDDGGVVVSSHPTIPLLTLAEGPGQALLLEQFYDPSPSVRNRRVRFRRIDLEPPMLQLVAVSQDCSLSVLGATLASEPRVAVQGRFFRSDGGISTDTAQTNTSGLAVLSVPLDAYSSVEFSAADDLGNTTIQSAPLSVVPMCGGGAAGGGAAGGGAAGGIAGGGVQTTLDEPGERDFQVGCGCGSTGESLLLLLIMPMIRRRREGRPAAPRSPHCSPQSAGRPGE